LLLETALAKALLIVRTSFPVGDGSRVNVQLTEVEVRPVPARH